MSGTREKSALETEEARRAEAPAGGKKKRAATGKKRFAAGLTLDILLRFFQLAASVAAFGITVSLTP